MKNLISIIALLSLVGCALSRTTAFAPQSSESSHFSMANFGRILQGTPSVNDIGYGPAVAFLAAGVFLSFFGYKAFKVTVFLIGFIVCGGIYFAFQGLSAYSNGESVPITTYLITIVIGCIGGWLNLFCLKLTYFLIGASVGAAAALGICAVLNLPSLMTTLAIIGLIAGGIAGVWFFQICIIVGTSILGAGLANTGLTYLFTKNAVVFTMSSLQALSISQLIMSIAIIAIIAGLGVIKQWKDFIGEKTKEALEAEKKAPLQEGYIVEMPATSKGVSHVYSTDSSMTATPLYDPYRPQQQQV